MNLELILSRLRQYPVATGASLLALILAVTAYLRMDAVPQLMRSEGDLSTEVATMDRNVTQAVSLPEHAERIRSAVVAINERLMEQDQKAINYQYLYDLERESRVRITGMAQNDVITDARQRAGRPNPSLFIGVPFNVTVQGPFGAVMEFLHRLETGRRFARIDVFSLASAPGDTPDNVALTLQFEILGKK